MANNSHIIPGILINDPLMPNEDLAQIQVLTQAAAKSKWDVLIDPRANHFMKMPDDAWPSILIRNSVSLYQWQDDWNANQPAIVQELLHKVWAPSTIVHIFWHRDVAVMTTHEILCRNWINFLYEDEGVLIRTESDNKAIVISCNSLWIKNAIT